MNLRTSRAGAALLVVALSLVGSGCSAGGADKAPSSPTPPAAATASPAPTASWPGQLNGPAPLIALATSKTVLVRDRKKLSSWTPDQVNAAWTQLRQTLGTTAQSPALVDPSKTLTAADFTQAAGANMTGQGLKRVGVVGAAALTDEDGAPDALRPLLLWYGAADASAAPELRLAAQPYKSNTLVGARVTGLRSGTSKAIAFQVATELSLRLVDKDGGKNSLTLTRTLQVAMVPDSLGAWKIDAWAGSWQVTKPVGQKLPSDTAQTKAFNPRNLGGSTSTTTPAPAVTPAPVPSGR